MIIEERDLLSVTEGIIAHQVNCQGAMGAGVAKAIRSRYPAVYNQYRQYLSHFNEHISPMGTCLIVNPTGDSLRDDFHVANLFSQDDHGTDRRHTNYFALAGALDDLAFEMENMTQNAVYIPYELGCGLGGGSWDTVSALIEDWEYASGVEVVACRLPAAVEVEEAA